MKSEESGQVSSRGIHEMAAALSIQRRNVGRSGLNARALVMLSRRQALLKRLTLPSRGVCVCVYVCVCGSGGRRRKQVVSELLAGGSEVSAEDFDGSTPLHCAAHYGNVRVVQALLDAGAKVSIRNSSGQTPLLVAAEACGCRWMGQEEGPGGYDYVDVVRRLLAAAETEQRAGGAEAEGLGSSGADAAAAAGEESAVEQ
ncbi:hypothetical protein Vretimale_9196, partial [Volvox reticuliferus]